MITPTIEFHQVKSLVPWNGNPRVHSKDQIERLASSIRHHGLTSIPVIQAGTLRILAGHGRWEAMMAEGHGETVIPCSVVDCSTEDADAYTLADNHLGELSRWNDLDLKEILANLDNGAFPVDLATGFSLQEIAALFGGPIDVSDAEIAEHSEPEVLHFDIEVSGNGIDVFMSGQKRNKKTERLIHEAVTAALFPSKVKQ